MSMIRKDMGFEEHGWTLNGPGVFIQGLLVCDATGEVVHRTLLDNQAARKLNAFGAERGVTVVAYTTGEPPAPPSYARAAPSIHRRASTGHSRRC